ncbi:MATE family efflux transporter [Alkalibacterium olivapovliticus]|uniref:Putative MATE family efflux protein n=1 Tax=Alkalibacterium olivapovliticus TaxID=99907 RepID=A0A2T0W5K4_9LACT|nr:MATE family efflux transporter [Alkalibacterium olivapovliticus]PRY81359.1 putative MATE family efflux protein [Alkalibacterium olivapovliticus]
MQRSMTLFFKYVSLNMLGMLGISFYILADTLFIAQALGSTGIAALNLSIPAFGIIHGFGLMLGLGGATRYKILLSQNKVTESRRVYSQTFLFAVIMGLIFMAIGLFGAAPMARALGADAETFEMTTVYLRTILTFAPFFVVNNMLLSFVRNDGDPSLAMYGMVIGSVLNVVLDYIFIFPLGMGMFGASLATSVSPIFSLMILSIHFFKPTNQLKLTFQKIEGWLIRDVTYLGASAFINELSASIVMFSFNTIIFSLEGNDGLAAYGIITNIAFVVMSLFAGVAQGAQPLLSESFGLKNLKQMKQVLFLSLVTTLIVSLTVYGGTALFTEQIISAFNSDQNAHIATMATYGLLIYFAGFIFAGMNTILTSYFGATDQPNRALFFSLLRGGLIIIPLALILSHYYGMIGVWSSYVITEALILIIVASVINPNKRIKKTK